MGLGMVFQQLWQYIRRQCRNNTHTEAASYGALPMLDQFLYLCRFSKYYFCLLYNLLAYLGSGNGMFVTVKESYIELFLQFVDLHAQSRLRYKTFFGCSN